MHLTKLLASAFSLIGAVALATAPLAAAEKTLPTSGPFQPIAAELLDRQAFSQWVSGSESPLSIGGAPIDPAAIVWTATTQPQLLGIKFGEARDAGMRHLRIGLTQPAAVGSVLVRGGGTLSILKPEATYPGNLADDSQWIAAERIVDGGISGSHVSAAEVDRESFVLWTLPAGTRTRALRFSHSPTPSDREQAGWLGGVWINAEHVANTAPQALVQSTMRDDISRKLVNESNDREWRTWDNGEQGAALPVSPEHPAVITLTWPRPLELAGVTLIWAGCSAVEVDAFTGSDQEIIAEASPDSWQRAGGLSDFDTFYPVPLGPHWLAFEKPLSTRALRLRITATAKLKNPNQGQRFRRPSGLAGRSD
ncbi:MAG TPA: hypothetical protein VGG30_02530, partial [Pirellulales bacterium]